MTTSGSKDLLVSRADGVLTLTFNRPDFRNALTPAMLSGLAEELAAAELDASVGCIVLTGAGGAFCAGGDVRSMNSVPARTPEAWRSSMRRAHRIVRALHALDRPVIAAVDGVAFGAGFSLSLLADILLVSERARFCMAFGRIGLIPDYGALYTLPRVVGLQRAKEIMFSAREIGAREACDLGIALEVLAPDALLARARSMARAFVAASPTALALTKDALHGALQSDLESLLELEAAGQGIAGTSDYAREAFRRFAEKQPGRFQWPASTVRA